MKLKTLSVFAAAIIGVAAMFASAQAAETNPFLGTWILNAAKSSYSPGPAPTSETLTRTDAGDGKVKTTIDTVAADGTKQHNEATYAYDGKDYPAIGGPRFDTVSAKRVDAATIEVTLKLAGKTVETRVLKVSEDGKSSTVTTTGAAADGAAIKNISAYDRK